MTGDQHPTRNGGSAGLDLQSNRVVELIVPNSIPNATVELMVPNSIPNVTVELMVPISISSATVYVGVYDQPVKRDGGADTTRTAAQRRQWS